MLTIIFSIMYIVACTDIAISTFGVYVQICNNGLAVLGNLLPSLGLLFGFFVMPNALNVLTGCALCLFWCHAVTTTKIK